MDTNLLQGARVWLTSLSRADAHTIARWENDSEYLRMMDSAPAHPRSEDEVLRWVDSLSRAEREYTFGIRLLETDSLIGWVQLDGIEWAHRTSSIGIGIGSYNYRGQGYGTEAMTLALNFAFNELNLHRVSLTVFSYNQRAVRVYENLGFQLEGRYREHIQRDGRRYDMLLYGLLSHEWNPR